MLLFTSLSRALAGRRSQQCQDQKQIAYQPTEPQDSTVELGVNCKPVQPSEISTYPLTDRTRASKEELVEATLKKRSSEEQNAWDQSKRSRIALDWLWYI